MATSSYVLQVSVGGVLSASGNRHVCFTGRVERHLRKCRDIRNHQINGTNGHAVSSNVHTVFLANSITLSNTAAVYVNASSRVGRSLTGAMLIW